MAEAAPSGDEQARRLRDLIRSSAAASEGRRPGAATTIAVGGGKGGVGKTNVAVNLGLLLAARGLRVTLLDLDMGMADADLLLGVHPPYNLAHVLSGMRELEEVCVR